MTNQYIKVMQFDGPAFPLSFFPTQTLHLLSFVLEGVIILYR